MEKKTERAAHILAIPYPSQGHINPMLQFCKQLTLKGDVTTTFAITNFISKSLKPDQSHHSINIDTISDGYDDGGFSQANSISSYISAFETAGSTSLAELIEKYSSSMHEYPPITCVLYDSFLPWALEVARNYGLVGAAFFTQSCAVDYIYYHLHHGSLRLPTVISSSSSEPGRVCIPGLPLLEIRDMPGFVGAPEAYPAYFELVLQQWSNLNTADFLLINTYYELESEAVNCLSALLPNPVLTIGPTVPSTYLKTQHDQQREDRAYGLDLFRPETPAPIIHWLNTKPPRSVIYASFGSMSDLTQHQMTELAYGLKRANYPYLWAIRSSEMSKLPGKLLEETTAMEKEEEEDRRCLIVPWISQVEVLAHESIGCFLSHCGWNSCVEALSLGVPIVAMPQWTDQPTDAKFVEDVWKVGVRVKVDDEEGWVRREEVEACLKEVMEGDRSDEMRKNARKWSDLAKQSIRQGGSTHKNIDRFVSACVIAASTNSLN